MGENKIVIQGAPEKRIIYLITVLATIFFLLIIIYAVFSRLILPARQEAGEKKTPLPRINSENDYKKIIENTKNDYDSFMKQNKNRLQDLQ